MVSRAAEVLRAPVSYAEVLLRNACARSAMSNLLRVRYVFCMYGREQLLFMSAQPSPFSVGLREAVMRPTIPCSSMEIRDFIQVESCLFRDFCSGVASSFSRRHYDSLLIRAIVYLGT